MLRFFSLKIEIERGSAGEEEKGSETKREEEGGGERGRGVERTRRERDSGKPNKFAYTGLFCRSLSAYTGLFCRSHRPPRG